MPDTTPTALALALTLTVTACAPGPDAIAPATLPEATYTGLTCSRATTLRDQTSATLAALEERQRTVATGDALAVFLIGLPVSGLTGSDAQGRIATEKGRLLALDARLARC